MSSMFKGTPAKDLCEFLGRAYSPKAHTLQKAKRRHPAMSIEYSQLSIPKLGTKTVQNAEEEKAIDREWYNNPGQFPKPSAVVTILRGDVKPWSEEWKWFFGAVALVLGIIVAAKMKKKRKKKGVVDRCKLCGRRGELQRSHFLPAALYGMILRQGGAEGNPMVVTREITVQT